ncbi:beta strand repeat-containing protein [Kitasatospora mediocidica]|uniref:beta strand repeat-containing protein n=1 Tax=Kitasatospora mediocidica TaxID=58352 RepID=UPI0007C6F2E3|nr:hypothetical protein [Kitasatospora mediocidica]
MSIREFRSQRGLRRWVAVAAVTMAMVASAGTAATATAATGAPSAAPTTGTPTTSTPKAVSTAPKAAAAKPHISLPEQHDLSGAFVPAGPTRLLDTRDGTGTHGLVKPVGNNPLLLDVSQVTGNPSVTPTAVVLNVTVTSPTSAGFLTVYPYGGNVPGTSNLNFTAGQTVANQVTVPVGTNGLIGIANFAGTADVIADLAGYYTLDKAAATYVADGPARVLDTRDGTGTAGHPAPIGTGKSVALQIAGIAGVPATGVTAVTLNVTATDTSSQGFLTVYPDGKNVPTASNLNFLAGQTVPNLVTVPVGTDGKVDFYNFAGTTDVVADLAGYYLAGAPQTGGVLRTLDAPTRLLDTRDGTGTSGKAAPIGTGKSIGLQVAGNAGIPAANVTAVVLNVTVTNASSQGFLTVYPDGKNVPTASNLNFLAGQTVPNLVTVPVGADGKVDFYNFAGTTDVIADVFGYFSAGDQLALTSLNFATPTVDASAGYTPVAVNWTLTDSNPAATQTGGEIVIRQQGSTPDTYIGQPYVVPYSSTPGGVAGATLVSGNAANSSYSYTFSVPRYAASATAKWAVTLVSAFETTTQQQLVLAGSALSGYGDVLTATEAVSTVTPTYNSLTLMGIPSRYLYDGVNTMAEYELAVQDIQSGFGQGTLTLSGPGGRTLSTTFAEMTNAGESSWPCLHGVCSFIVVFPAGTAGGVWAVSTIALTNNAGQTRTYSNLNAVPLTLTSNSTLSADHFTATPNPVNSWQGNTPFQVSMHVNGAQSGVQTVQLSWASCSEVSATPTLNADGSYSVQAVMYQSNNGQPNSCHLTGVSILDGAGNVALYGSEFAAPDPGLTVKSVADTTPPTVTSAALNVTSIAQSKAAMQSFVVTAKVNSPTAPVNGFSSYLYDSTGTIVGQSLIGTPITPGPDGTVRLNVNVPNPIPVGTYTIGFSINDAGWLSSSYGMPGTPPVPGGPLTLTVTAG